MPHKPKNKVEHYKCEEHNFISDNFFSSWEHIIRYHSGLDRNVEK